MSDSEAHSEPTERTEPIELREPAATRGRRRGRAALAGVAAIAVVAAAAGIALAGRDGRHSHPRASGTPTVLHLLASPKESPRVATANGAAIYPFRPRTFEHGAWPTLATKAPVARLTAGDIGEARAREIARILGVDATPRASTATWTISDSDRTVTLTRTPSGWGLSLYAGNAVDVGGGPGATGSSGSGSSSATSGSSGSGTASPPVTSTIAVPPRTVATTPAPKHLPTVAAAEQIARDVLVRLGLDPNGWTAAVDSADQGVASVCAGTSTNDASTTTECAPPPPAVVTQRSVTLTPSFDGHPTSGMEWSITVGDNGTIEAAYGTLSTLTRLADYPLRTIDAAYKDLVAGVGQAVPESAIQPRAALVPRPECPPNAACLPTDVKPTVVTVTDVQLAYDVELGQEGTTTVGYLVPAYRFVEQVDGVTADVHDDVIAIDDPLVDNADVTAGSTTTFGTGGGDPVPPVEPQTGVTKPPVPGTTPASEPAPDTPTSALGTTNPGVGTTVPNVVTTIPAPTPTT